jgi:hypothetical protein
MRWRKRGGSLRRSAAGNPDGNGFPRLSSRDNIISIRGVACGLSFCKKRKKKRQNRVLVYPYRLPQLYLSSYSISSKVLQ